MSSIPVYGAIEAGGTKFVCAIATAPDERLEEARFATTTPDDTLRCVLEFFEGAQKRHGDVRSFGLATFGPVDLNPGSPRFGRLLSTPKPGWSDADIPSALRRRFDRPVFVDTDVNAAALAELRFGAGKGLRSLAYVTVGTGIGGGVVIDGRSVTGLLHPEMGHINVRRHPLDQEFSGVCPFHADCLEGLASGPAITARWGAPLSALGPAHSAGEIISNYLGQLAASIALMISCERIVFGGGVALESELLPQVRRAANAMLNGYIPALADETVMDSYIVPAVLGAQAGLTGALLLAQS